MEGLLGFGLYITSGSEGHPDGFTSAANMNHDSYPDTYISNILHSMKSFALVGASANKVRPSYFVLKYLLAKGYSCFPINPGLAGGEILGHKVYASLSDLDEPGGRCRDLPQFGSSPRHHQRSHRP